MVVIISVADITNDSAAKLSREIAQIEPRVTHLPSNVASRQSGGGDANSGTGASGAVSTTGAGDSAGGSGTKRTKANGGSGDEGASCETEATSASGSDVNSGQSSNAEQITSSSGSSAGSGCGAGSGRGSGMSAESGGCGGLPVNCRDSQGSGGTQSSGCNT